MSYAYHPLSRVGAFTKGSSDVRTYGTRWDLWEHPVTQCSDCLASAKSRCTCRADRAAAKRATTATSTARVATTPVDVVDWEPKRTEADPVSLRDDLVMRHLDHLAKLPVTLVGGYLANLPKQVRLDVVSYL